MFGYSEMHKRGLEAGLAWLIDAVDDGGQVPGEAIRWDHKIHRRATRRASREVSLDRCRLRTPYRSGDVAGEQLLIGVPGRIRGHVSAFLSWTRARALRLLTVPVGMRNSLAASRVLSPSRTVAWTTDNNSGDSRSNAPASSPW